MLWEQFTAYITTAAAELPESTYSYRPTAAVRSFGQLVGHVAGAQYRICAAAMGEPPREEDEIERSRTAAQQGTKLFGQEQTRLYALGLNAAHNAEHYGNIVTYLRLNGIVPPSSRRGS